MLCKGVHCVDLGESFQTHIFLQNLASIQPRTSPFKLARPSEWFAARPGDRRKLTTSVMSARTWRLRLSGETVPVSAAADEVHALSQSRDLQDSFSAVSKPNFASKYAFESSRRDLHNALLCTALKSHFLKNLLEFCQKKSKIFHFFLLINFYRILEN